jgi:surface protein
MTTYIIDEQGIFIPNDKNIHDAVRSYLEGNPDGLPTIGKWNTSNIKLMNNLFANLATFNEDINDWDVSNVQDMSWMFWTCRTFNQPLNKWNVSNMKKMGYMFAYANSFNQDIASWNVSKVQDMGGMFTMTPFNFPLNSWNVSRVTVMKSMFSEASSFNQPLNNWNVSNVGDFNSMFFKASSFNQPLNNWNVSNGGDFSNMFVLARSFNQDISNWVINRRNGRFVDPRPQWTGIFRDTNMPENFKPLLLRDDIPPAPMPQALQGALQGIAFQVHKAFDSINFQKLFQLINNNAIDTYSLPKPFKEYVIDEIQSMLTNYSGEDKDELQQKFTALLPKMRSIDYGVQFKMTPNPAGKDAFFTILNFVKKQEHHYQDNYITFFINDSFNAYDKGDTTSCAKGIKE